MISTRTTYLNGHHRHTIDLFLSYVLRELEHAKQRWLAKAGEAPLDFEVDGSLVTTEAPSLTVEAEAEAARAAAAEAATAIGHRHPARNRGKRACRTCMPRCPIWSARPARA